MKLLTKEIEARLPALYSNEGLEDPVVQVKFFTPWTGWTWWATEYDPATRVFFGLVQGFEVELGTFALADLEEIRGPGGMTIERDLHFEPRPLSEIRAEL